MNNTLTYNRHNDKTLWTYYVSIITNLLIIDTIINLSTTLLYLSNYEQTMNRLQPAHNGKGISAGR